MTRKALFMTAACRDLAILNYEVDRSVLAGRVPPGCELDDWQGKHFVTIVGLRFLRPRFLGVSLPFLADAIEVNLGFYVRRHAGSAWRRGVALIKELSSQRLFRGDAATLEADIPRLFGPEFMEALSFPPRTALTADGSSVIVRQRHRID
jgi:uncharacterized protein YqjF (DUF2071 family)